VPGVLWARLCHPALHPPRSISASGHCSAAGRQPPLPAQPGAPRSLLCHRPSPGALSPLAPVTVGTPRPVPASQRWAKRWAEPGGWLLPQPSILLGTAPPKTLFGSCWDTAPWCGAAWGRSQRPAAWNPAGDPSPAPGQSTPGDGQRRSVSPPCDTAGKEARGPRCSIPELGLGGAGVPWLRDGKHAASFARPRRGGEAVMAVAAAPRQSLIHSTKREARDWLLLYVTEEERWHQEGFFFPPPFILILSQSLSKNNPSSLPREGSASEPRLLRPLCVRLAAANRGDYRESRHTPR